tara:strand:+ start:1162 stop:1590 length:429 start_codon:yes stop_codon:yes gene_type:complete
MKEEKNKIYKVYENRPSIYLVEARSEEEAEKIFRDSNEIEKAQMYSDYSEEIHLDIYEMEEIEGIEEKTEQKTFFERQYRYAINLLGTFNSKKKMFIRDWLVMDLVQKNQEPIYFDSDLICTHSMFDECYYHNELLDLDSCP